MKLLVLYNMASGYGDAAIFDYVRTLMQDGDEVVMRASDGTTDIREFLFDAEGYDAVAVSGGDGTISSIAHLLADTGIPIIPFPGGTANLLSLNLESPTEVHALVEMTREARCMDFDIGELSFPDGSKSGFTLMAGAGYDALIMRDAGPNKKLLGSMAYFTSAIANAAPQHAKIEIDIDGEHVETSGVGILIVNFSRIQFDLTVVHENMPCDGELDVVILHTKDALGLIPALFAAMLDRDGGYPPRGEAFQIMRGKSVRVTADPPLPVQFDGEVSGQTTPFEARVLEGAARFIVSEQCVKLHGTSTGTGSEAIAAETKACAERI